MPKKGFSAEQIVTLLRQIEVSMAQGKSALEQWRKHYNTIRPHSALNYRPPAPQTMNRFLTPLDQAVQMQ
jgi:putative transposase